MSTSVETLQAGSGSTQGDRCRHRSPVPRTAGINSAELRRHPHAPGATLLAIEHRDRLVLQPEDVDQQADPDHDRHVGDEPADMPGRCGRLEKYRRRTAEDGVRQRIAQSHTQARMSAGNSSAFTIALIEVYPVRMT